MNIITIEDIINDQKENSQIKTRKNSIMENGIFHNKNKKKKKIILSENFSKKLIKLVHEQFCHIGINQIESKIRPFYTAPILADNIKSVNSAKFVLKIRLG